MDKQNYIISGIEEQAIRKEFRKIRSKIIKTLKEKHVICRKRVVDYQKLVCAAYEYIVKRLSFQRLSDVMASKYRMRMSDTAWKKQLRKVSPVFLEAVRYYMSELSACHSETKQDEPPVYAIDATDIAQVGKTTAIMRVHTQLSLDDHASVYATITNNHVSENIRHFPIQEHFLYLADRAYGKTSQFAYLFQHHADFAIRISPHQIKLYSDEKCCHRINFSSILCGQSISIKSYIQCNKKVYCLRIVGEKLPEEKQARAEKRVKRKSSKNGCTIRSETVLYSKWMLVASSLGSKYSPKELLSLYRKRWQIELFFKRSKTHLGLRKNRYSTEGYKVSFLQLWLGVVLTLCSLQLICVVAKNACISDFNSFSLLLEFIA